jgi:organic radical activating enzyme
MSKKVIQIRQGHRIFQLTWIINNICTNHCDYCPDVLHTGTNHHYDWEKAKSFAQRLIKQHPKIRLAISGGEPTVSPFFPELVDLFHAAGHSVGVTTNGARTAQYWSKIAHKFEYICFSYHPSQPDSEFLDKVLEAAKHTVVTVRVMMDSRHWDQAQQFYEDCKKYDTFNKEPVKILPEMAFNTVGSQYSEEQLTWLESTPTINLTNPIYKSNSLYRRTENRMEVYYDDGDYDLYADAHRLILSDQNHFSGWACNIGLESLYIHYDGTVKKANCWQGGHLFHINDHEKHQLPTKAELCYQDMCFCGTDVLISKVPIFDQDSELVRKSTVIRFKQE